MASQGPNSPATAANDTSIGVTSWTSPNDVFTSNNVRANIYGGFGNFVSHYLKATNFGFSIPSGATINGIVAEIETSTSTPQPNGNVADYSVKIVKGGTISGTNKAGNNWSSTESYKTYGTSSDLWGVSWTDTDINSSDFGVGLSVTYTYDSKEGPSTLQIDHVRITVYYTAGGGGGSSSKNQVVII